MRASASHDGDENRATNGACAHHTGAAPSQDRQDAVEMPAPTIWPLVLALGITLTSAGVVTNALFSAGGLLLVGVALGGWIRELLPGAGRQRMAFVPPSERAPAIRPKPLPFAAVSRPAIAHRARLPETLHPYSAGIAGGAAGGVAMAAVALIYGLISGRGVWYPVNLLAAMLMPGAAEWSTTQLQQFHLGALALGLLIHGISSLGVGLLFSLLFPMLPGRPVVRGGLVGPLLWSSGIYAFMGVLNPVMNSRVDWTWFILSQFAYGLVAGIVVGRTVVGRTEKVLPAKPGKEAGPEDRSRS